MEHDNIVALLPPNLEAKRTKRLILKFVALVTARTQCGIAVVTPAIFIYYCQNTLGMK